MIYILIFLAGMHVFSALVTISQIGKARKTLTPGTATGVVAINLLIVAAIVWALVTR